MITILYLSGPYSELGAELLTLRSLQSTLYLEEKEIPPLHTERLLHNKSFENIE